MTLGDVEKFRGEIFHFRGQFPGASRQMIVENLDCETAKTQVPAPEDLRPLTGHRQVVLHARFTHDGVVYARSSTHIGNSLIYFYPGGELSLTPVPGCIKYIFNGPNGISFAVQRHLDSAVNTVNPFAPYPDFPAALYSSSLAEKLEVVEVGWVTSHFARWKISSENVVVISLSKVRHPASPFCRYNLIEKTALGWLGCFNWLNYLYRYELRATGYLQACQLFKLKVEDRRRTLHRHLYVQIHRNGLAGLFDLARLFILI